MSSNSREMRIERTQAIWAQVEWDHIATFIGPNADRFQNAWEKTREQIAEKGYGAARSFCWPVLFFSFAWFFARKQWAIGAVLLVLPLLLGMVFKGSSGGLLGITLVFTIYAKSFYLQFAMRKIALILDSHPDGAARDAALRTAGGISLPGVIIGGLLVALAYMSVAAVLSGPR